MGSPRASWVGVRERTFPARCPSAFQDTIFYRKAICHQNVWGRKRNNGGTGKGWLSSISEELRTEEHPVCASGSNGVRKRQTFCWLYLVELLGLAMEKGGKQLENE